MTLQEMRSAIPADCFRPSLHRALACVAVGAVLYGSALAFGYLVWARGWTYAYPLSWIITGTSVTSMFVLGHDCGHRSLLRSDRAMVVLGHVFFLPTLYPFFAWQYSHQAHHRHTNLMARTRDVDHDNTWLPITGSSYDRLLKRHPRTAWLYLVARVFLPLGTTIHLVSFHFRAAVFKPSQRAKVRASLAFVVASGVVAATAVLKTTGSPFLLLHLWIIPALVFQGWMSLYTFLHHTATDKRVFLPDEWTPFRGQVESTINCLFPRIISWIHFNIDVHLPHHVSTKVPCYHLRLANSALRSSPYARYMTERPFSVAYLVRQVRQCQVWDEALQRYASVRSRGPVRAPESRERMPS